MSGSAHVPVLLGPVLEGLRILQKGVYVDGTFGRGGHARAILERLGAGGRLISIDRDPQAIAGAEPDLLDDTRFELIRGELGQLETIVEERGLKGRVNGILLDIGVSSPQLDDAARGFSFRFDGPLDMRMDPESGVSAAEWLSDVSERELKATLRRYGEEPNAARIAHAIVAARGHRSIETTGELAAIVRKAAPAGARASRIDPATRTFQAIRIVINDELGQLEAALDAALRLLCAGGRLCVITFHSLEDRIVKRFMREHSRDAAPYRGLPDVPAQFRAALRLIGKPITASPEEVASNPRARSARLRIAERAA
jgi:16S rRNA (cytosine1402-N4)-methyltransferase